MKKIVCIVILILAITGLLNGISYLISGISARGIGGVNYGRVILTNRKFSIFSSPFLKNKQQ